MTTFALDTATSRPSMALEAGGATLAELRLSPEPGSGRRVLEGVHGLLTSVGRRAADIEEIVVGVGPGGFTGLRIGVATALGLGQALGVPVRGASSLEALALGIADAAEPGAVVVPALDARRGELFAAAYRADGDGLLDELIPPLALAPADLAERLTGHATPEAPAVIAGEGVAAGGAALVAAHMRPLGAGHPAGRLRAAHLIARVRAGGERPARPEYARLPDAEINRRRAEGLPA